MKTAIDVLTVLTVVALTGTAFALTAQHEWTAAGCYMIAAALWSHRP